MRWKAGGTLLGTVLGALVGTLGALLAFAPASWLAHELASATRQHVLLTDTRGSIWSGSGVLVLTGGADSSDASALPDRLEWSVGMQGLALAVRVRQACCITETLPVLLRPGLGGVRLSLSNPGQPLRLPAAWTAGLGTPWNTLQLGGMLQVQAQDLQLAWSALGALQWQGRLTLDFVDLSSRVSTLASLGSYTLAVDSDPDTPGAARLHLSTRDGALHLQGEGRLAPDAHSQFHAEAQAAPGMEAALDNILNIIGRRQGARSIITIG
ncbi:MAG: type II secretion system protein N [Burkholderiaceae bacterium]|nr:type II secretion system protein N [Roseateles sp.]MBV8469284.1 type II secretion system protein N [Burkholderiaceae bacterium]